MAREYSAHQQKLIRNFYRNRGAIDLQRLQELVTEIYLLDAQGQGAGKKAQRHWQRVEEILGRTDGMDADLAAQIVEQRDVEALAQLAGTQFGG